MSCVLSGDGFSDREVTAWEGRMSHHPLLTFVAKVRLVANFWATEAALGFAMVTYNLMSVFRQAVMRSRIQHTLSTLHGLVLTIGSRDKCDKTHLLLSLPLRKREWFYGLWVNAPTPLISASLIQMAKSGLILHATFLRALPVAAECSAAKSETKE